ncbi:MAG: hypothetical protein RR357_05860, partial [Clostridia bacterium]
LWLLTLGVVFIYCSQDTAQPKSIYILQLYNLALKPFSNYAQHMEFLRQVLCYIPYTKNDSDFKFQNQSGSRLLTF